MSHVAGGHGEALAAELAAVDFSGVVLAVGPDGLLAEVAMGDADRANGRPNTMSTRFAVASVGKLFTAVALVRLVERGLVPLDARAVDLLPADRRPPGLGADVTLEHLLTHQSGLEDYIDDAGGQDFAELWVDRNPGLVRAPADLLPLFGDRPPRAAPGAEVRYNDGAFVILGLVLEALTERSYYDVVADEVFAPAGMTATGFPAMDEVVPDLANGYLRPEADGEPWRTNIYASTGRGQPDGGVFTTAADLIAFVDAFLAGRLVGERWRDEMLRPRAWSEEDEMHFGLAFQMGGEGRRAWIGHSGGDPGVGANVSWFPEAGIRTAVITNAPPGAFAAYRALRGLLLAARRLSRRTATSPCRRSATRGASIRSSVDTSSARAPSRCEQLEHLVALLVAEQHDDLRRIGPALRVRAARAHQLRLERPGLARVDRDRARGRRRPRRCPPAAPARRPRARGRAGSPASP